MNPKESRLEEFLRRENQRAIDDLKDAGDGFLFVFGLFAVIACLFGAAYLISLGWHMGAG